MTQRIQTVLSTTLSLGLLAGPLTGCDDDFEPRSHLIGYRVIGISADRPEIGPDDTVRLTVHDYDSEGRVADYAWKICFLSFGQADDYACADPALEFEIVADGPEADVDLGPDGFDLRGAFERFGPFPGADGQPTTLADGIDVQIEVVSGPQDGRIIDSIKRMRVRDGGTPNTNPGIAALTVDGRADPAAAAPGADVELAVQIAPGSEEDYVDYAGRQVTEELLLSWYTTDGELDADLTFGDDLDNTLTLPDASGPVEVFVAVRDGRGGLAVENVTIPISAP